MKNNEITLKERLDLTSGKSMWEFNGIKTRGIDSVRVSDGPTGLRYVSEDAIATQEVADEATCYLTESSVANTFNPELLYAFGEALGKECRRKNVDILLAPGMNIKRLPVCGRNFEYYSEDPYLTSVLASSFVRGIEDQGVGACLKHLLCNSQESYRYTINSVVDERALNEIYLNAFRLTVMNEHPMAIMTAYNKTNGLYTAENKELLSRIRNEFGFNGLFISDWGAVSDAVNSLKAGLNVEMPSNDRNRALIEEAYRKKELDVSYLNDNADIMMDVYERINHNRNLEIDVKDSAFSKETAYKVASEACVLLKNDDHVLPLKEDDDLLVIGDLFLHPNTQGYGSSQINYKHTTSFMDEFKKYNPNFKFKRGYSLDESNTISLLNDAVNEAKKHQKIVIFVGYSIGDAEGVDRKSLALPSNQLAVLAHLVKLNKKIIVVINNGGIVELPFTKKVKGILHSFLLGEVHEQVVSETLFGKINPSGKLAESYPIKYDDTMVKKQAFKDEHNAIYHESIYVGYRYYDSFNIPVQFPFGHGLSYSNFLYQNIYVAQEDEYKFKVSFNLVNKSDIDGKEVCQVYVRNKTSNNYHPFQELKAFKKVFVRANGSEVVNIMLDEHAFEFYNDKSHRFEIEGGTYEIAVGTSSRDLKLIKYVKIKGNETELRFSKDQLVSYFEHKPLENFEFQKILGYEVKNEDRSTYNYDSIIIEVREKLLGRLIYKMIKKEYCKANKFLPAEVSLEMLDYVPLRMVVSMSNGMLSSKLCDAIIYGLNHNFIVGVHRILKTMREEKKQCTK